MNLQNNEPAQNSQNIWTISISVLVTTLIVCGGLFLWQKSQAILRQEIQSLKSQNEKLISKTQNNEEQKKSARNNLKAISIKKSGNFNYFIYTDEKGIENILDKAPWNFDNWEKLVEDKIVNNISEIRPFLDARFSPLENYILLTKTIYEGGDTTSVYNIKNKKGVDGIYGTTALEFTLDEKYLISCDYGRNFPTAKIYETGKFKEIYSLFGNIIGEGETQFYNGYRIKHCNWNNDTKKVRFYLENFSNPTESRELFYDITNGKISE